jgi:sialate O-acetylesterase
MVLQREMPLPVWGEAAAGETVTVEFAGQSNMAMSVGSSADAEREIAGAIHPEIRIFRVPANPAREPVVDFKAAWEVCSPETAAGFSAVGYFFGREIQPAVGVPVGLLV